MDTARSSARDGASWLAAMLSTTCRMALQLPMPDWVNAQSSHTQPRNDGTLELRNLSHLKQAVHALHSKHMIVSGPLLNQWWCAVLLAQWFCLLEEPGGMRTCGAP